MFCPPTGLTPYTILTIAALVDTQHHVIQHNTLYWLLNNLEFTFVAVVLELFPLYFVIVLFTVSHYTVFGASRETKR